MRAGNPARTLRAAVEALRLPGMLRWDASGRALLVSDAPRRMPATALEVALARLAARAAQVDGLLYMDLPEEAYAALLTEDVAAPGPWQAAWFAEQALLAGMLVRPVLPADTPDKPLLRAALLSCAQGEPSVRGFLYTLRARDAAALRAKKPASVRACGVLCARWLWQEKGVGLPPVTIWRGSV